MKQTMILLAFLCAAASALAAPAPSAAPEWTMNATIIEACSCPMFCQCYFDTKPAAHADAAMAGEGHEHMHGGGQHYCRFNNAYKVNSGHFGSVKLDGAKFWAGGDLGGDFSQGKMDWVVLTFDKSTTPAQREAIQKIVGYVFPVQWNSFKTAEGNIDTWQYDKDSAVALLDGGKTAEVRLKRFPGMTAEPIVIKNLGYWGVKRHDGFVLMPNTVEAYRVGPKAFEFKGTNGFMITWDMNSNDVPPPAAGK